jgi:hypothetical protein
VHPGRGESYFLEEFTSLFSRGLEGRSTVRPLPCSVPEGSFLGETVEDDTDCTSAADLQKVGWDEYRTTSATVNCRKYP